MRGLSKFLAGAAAALLALSAAGAAAAAERVALLIGNADYRNETTLLNPKNDIDAMQRALEALGFVTEVVKDGDRKEMTRAMSRFRRTAADADTAVLFYSGHGMEAAGRNYLIPVDARMEHPDDAEVEAVALDFAVSVAAKAKRLSVVIIDACRNNRFPGAQRSGAKGFKPVRARRGQLVAFATAPGAVAFDGDGALSPFTQALTETLSRAEARSLDVRQLFGGLGPRVSELVQQPQEPFTHSSGFGLDTVPLIGGASVSSASASGSGSRSGAGAGAAVAPATEESVSDIGEDAVEAANAEDGGKKLFSLAWDYDSGTDGKPENHVVAARLYTLACGRGEPRSCTNLGYLYENGQGVREDKAEGARLYRKGCDLGNALGCTNLGFFNERGIGGPKDVKEAARLYGEGCRGGNRRGCTNLGYLYEVGRGVVQDKAEAARLYEKGCDAGHSRACTNLGLLYRRGTGVKHDEEEAARLYKKGCDGGNMRGCSNLGFLYDEGKGVPQDKGEATRLYKKGCDGDDALGCSNLGIQYEYGDGVEKDMAEAVRLYTKGCDGKDALGCVNLALAHQYAKGLTEDRDEAVRLYRRALELEPGNARATKELGKLGEKP